MTIRKTLCSGFQRDYRYTNGVSQNLWGKDLLGGGLHSCAECFIF